MRVSMKILFCMLFAIVFDHTTVLGQIFPGLPEPMKLLITGHAQGPKISADGKLIAFSREHYNSVEVFDLVTKEQRTICTHLGSGWGMVWLNNETIIARSTQEGVSFRDRKMGLELIDVKTGRESVIIPFAAANRIEVPRKSSSGNVAAWNSGTMILIDTDKIVKWGDLPADEAVASSEQGEILMGKESLRAPTNRALLSLVWSPDGSKALIELLGQPSLYILDRATQEFQSVAQRGEHPVWVNNDLYAYMETTDDGHDILTGDIFVASSVDGKRQSLTAQFDRVALTPTASVDGTIVFGTTTGELFIIQLPITKN